jgi:hypothetical protein
LILSIKEKIENEIKVISGITTVRLILNQTKQGTDFKVIIWFLNDQIISSEFLKPKINFVLKKNLRDHYFEEVDL